MVCSKLWIRFFCPSFGIVGRLQETRWYCRKERMTEGGKCAKKYINASDCFWGYIRCEKWSFRARSHSFNAHRHFRRAHTNTHQNLPPIRNRIRIETRKKIQLENFVWGKLSRVMLSNDIRLYTYPYSAHNTRALTPRSQCYILTCVSRKGLLHIYMYTPYIQHIERVLIERYIESNTLIGYIYIFLFFWWIVIGYRQHNRIGCVRYNARYWMESMYWNEWTNCPFLLVNRIFFPSQCSIFGCACWVVLRTNVVFCVIFDVNARFLNNKSICIHGARKTC